MTKTTETKNEALIVNAEDFGLKPEQAEQITKGLMEIVKERDQMIPQYQEILKMDIEDDLTAEKASELYKLIRNNRTKGIEPWHKASKEFWLRGGQFVDASKRKEIFENERMEENLLEIIKHQEKKEAARLLKVKEARIELLSEFEDYTPPSDIEHMSVESFAKLMDDQRELKEFRLMKLKKEQEENDAKQRKAELEEQRTAETINLREFIEDYDNIFLSDLSKEDYDVLLWSAKEAKKEHDAEQLRIKEENAKLKADAEKREADIAKQKKEAEEREAKIKAEGEAKLKAANEAAAKEKAESDAKAAALQKLADDAKAAADKKAAEEKAKAEKEAEEKRKASLAPDKDKLIIWLNNINAPEVSISSESAQLVAGKIIDRFNGFKKWASEQIDTLK